MRIALLFITALVVGCGDSVAPPDQPSRRRAAAAIQSGDAQKMDTLIPDSAPSLFRTKDFNCTSLVDAVNHYVSIGEAETIRELNSFAQEMPDYANGIDANERIGWVCRILFQAKHAPLRSPAFGGLGLPYRSMPLDKWPLYPVAKSGETYCVLSEGYSLGGQAEPVSSYLSYCAKNGRFRTNDVKIRSQDEATTDLNALRLSQRWLDIEWQGKGPGFSFFIDESGVWQSIIRQAKLTESER